MNMHFRQISRRPVAAQSETSDPDTLFLLDVLIGLFQFVANLKGR